MKGRTQRGFTLIELLVVIAIIGILSSVILASLNTARQKGRDARRISDVKQLQLAAELYYDANQSYPASLGSGTTGPLVTGGYISSIPVDPSTSAAYAYSPLQSDKTTGCTTAPSPACPSYVLGALLENSSNAVLTSSVKTNFTAAIPAINCSTSGEYCVMP